MGIADFGVGAGLVPYSYSTTQLLTNVSWTSQNIYNNSLGTAAKDLYSFQLNAFLGFVAHGGKTFYYWIQDVGTMDTTTRELQFMDCVWNATTASAVMKTTGTVTGNGSVSGGVYSWDSTTAPGGTITTGVAASFEMIIQSAMSSQGYPVVYLGYRDSGTSGHFQDFDTVTFTSARGVTSDDNFVVNGNAYNVWGTAYDAEIMVGGPYNGDFTVAHATTDMTYQIYEWNGHNFEAPQAAWNFGSETAESISSAQTYFAGDGYGAPGDNLLNGTAHNATTGSLYNQYQVGELTVNAPGAASGTVAIGGDSYPFDGGVAYLTLVPGTYHVWENTTGGSSNDLGMCTITAATNLSVSASTGCSGGGSGPVISSFTISPDPVLVGGSTALTVTTSGGTAPLVYSYAGLPHGCASANLDPLSCTPTAAGTYSITATVNDSAGHTTSAMSMLTVNAPPSPLKITSFVANPSNVSLDWATTLTVGTSGGTSPLVYAYTHLPPGCSSADTSSLYCTPTAAGWYNATVEVTDASTPTQHAWANATIWVEPPSSPLTIASFTATPNPITLGEATEINTTTAGGSGWVAFVYSGLPSGCSSALASQFSCTPSAVGTYQISVNASTSATQYALGSLTLQVNGAPPPLSVTTFNANPSLLELGQTTELTASATGGVGPYTFSTSVPESGCTFGSNANNSCTPTTSGTFIATLTVTDSLGGVATGTTEIQVLPELSLTGFVVTPTSLHLGSSAVFRATVIGGEAPYTYTYASPEELPPGCSFGDAANVTCSPSVTGNFTVELNVTDALHVQVEGQVELTVLAASPSNGGGGSSSGGPQGLSQSEITAVAVVAVLAAVVIVGVVLWHRRARVRPPEYAQSLPPYYPGN